MHELYCQALYSCFISLGLTLISENVALVTDMLFTHWVTLSEI